MDYLISDVELKELLKGYNTFPYPELSVRKYVDDFLKSKQSVELVAEGEVYDSSCEYSGGFHVGKGWGHESTDFDLCEIVNKYDKQLIKIYIQKQGVKIIKI